METKATTENVYLEETKCDTAGALSPEEEIGSENGKKLTMDTNAATDTAVNITAPVRKYSY